MPGKSLTNKPVSEEMKESSYMIVSQDEDVDGETKQALRKIPVSVLSKYLGVDELKKLTALIPLGNGDAYSIGYEEKISASLMDTAGSSIAVDNEYAYCAYYSNAGSYVGETLYVSGACSQTYPLYVFKDVDGIVIDMGWGAGTEELTVVEDYAVIVPEDAATMYINQLRGHDFSPCVTGYFPKMEVGEENLAEDVVEKINSAAVKKEVNSAFSNALKGTASGAIIALNDVSPVEHEVECVVTSETVALTTVNVSRYGKNISPIGTLTVQGTIAWKNDNVRRFLPAGKYVVSCNYEQTGTPTTIGMRVAHKDTDATVIQTKATDISGTLYVAFELTESKEYKVYLYANYSATALEEDAICEFTNIQIEVDNGTGTPTAYKEPVVYSYTPDAEGRIDGMTSISPYMTLVTDTPDACVEVVYNKDVNKAFEEAKTTLKDYVDEAILNGEW